MKKTSRTLLATVTALTLSGGAYAQSNNTLATPSTVSPAAKSTSDYGTPGGSNSDSGIGTRSPNSNEQSKGSNSTPATSAYGVNNTLATPGTASPVK